MEKRFILIWLRLDIAHEIVIVEVCNILWRNFKLQFVSLELVLEEAQGSC